MFKWPYIKRYHLTGVSKLIRHLINLPGSLAVQYEWKWADNTADVLIGVLSPQDQIDTLTFQNQSLKAKADRFEEALKKNTEEQLKVDDHSNYTGIKIHVSKYCTSPNSMKSNWILTPGTGGRSQLRS